MDEFNMDELEVQVHVTYKGEEWDNFDVSDVTLESIYDVRRRYRYPSS